MLYTIGPAKSAKAVNLRGRGREAREREREREREWGGEGEVGKRDQPVILDCIHVRYEAQELNRNPHLDAQPTLHGKWFLCSLWKRKESFMPFMANCKWGFYVFVP